MEKSLNITDIKKNFTKLEDELYDFVEDKVIKLHDVVIYAALKTQLTGGYSTSNGSLSRIFNLSKSTITDSISRLVDAKIVKTTYSNGKLICSIVRLDDEYFDKIPRALLMTDSIDLKQKAFMLASWSYVRCNSLPYTRKKLYEDVFSYLNVGIRWMNTRIDDLIDIGVLAKHPQEIVVDLSKVIEMSDMVIDSVLIDSSHLEDVVVAYEDKTGVTRDKIFDWKETKEVVKKEFNSPKWLEPITNAINAGCVALSKKPFDFTAGEFATIGKHVKDIIENVDGDSEERIIEKIANSIIWKTNNASRNENEKKYYTKGFFTRKTKNNLASNLYHFERDLESNPYGNSKPSVTKKVTKKVTKETGGFELFDYGIDL
tara:strand:+ start:909 stop:2027 length:1119 start_codon:yes stop_codon:yes gene_type:complete